MAFIKNKERENLIKRINKSYGFRKFLISVEILGLIAFIVVTFLSFYFVQKAGEGWEKWQWLEKNKLTPLGIGMLVFACLLAIFGLIALILTFTIKSPKKIAESKSKLESSALSGKKINKEESYSKQVKDRATKKVKK